jgi:hypothetical protein
MTGAERTDLAALARDYFEALRVLGKHSTCPSCGDRLPAARGHRCARRIGRQFLARAGGGGGMARMKILDEGRSAPEEPSSNPGQSGRLRATLGVLLSASPRRGQVHFVD